MHRSKREQSQGLKTLKQRENLYVKKKQNCEHLLALLLAISLIHVPPIEMLSLANYQARCSNNKCTV